MPRWLLTITMLVTSAGGATSWLAAQCPDGSPAPCTGQKPAPKPKRVDPPLDERTWIVLPFENLARRSEIDWLRHGSVSVMSADLAQWRDVHVVQAKHVTELLQSELGSRGEKLTLSDGLRVARRAGAGRLVMGEILHVGNRTRITASVFDVRPGNQIRTAHEETASADSLLLSFSFLARSILGLPPLKGLAALGATRVDAMQEYIVGIGALGRFAFRDARRSFEQALQLDSTFALAHYQIAMTMHWQNARDSATKRAHAAAAARLGPRLPARERSLIAAFNAFVQGDFARACATYARLANTDSSDVEAAYGLGECSYHDPVVERSAADTSQFVFRGSWNNAIKAYQRVLELDPALHLAFQRILEMLTREQRFGADPRTSCSSRSPGCDQFAAMLRRDADSLLLVPVPAVAVQQGDTVTRRELYRSGVAAGPFSAQRAEFDRTDARWHNLEQAVRMAQSWVDAAPNEGRARAAFGRVLLRAGRPQEALAHLNVPFAAFTPDEAWDVARDRVDATMRLARTADAMRILDSVRRNSTILPPGFGYLYAGMVGNLRFYDTTAHIRRPVFASAPVERSGIDTAQFQESLRQYARHVRRAVAGASTDSIVITEMQFLSARVGMAGIPRALVASSLLWGLRLPRLWPRLEYTPQSTSSSLATEPTGEDGIPTIAANIPVAVAKGDMQRLRSLVKALDTSTALGQGIRRREDGSSVIIAEAYLVLRDSSAALRTLRRMLDTSLKVTPLFSLFLRHYFFAPSPNVAAVLPRAMLLRAELEGAAGNMDHAALWFRRFLDLWNDADPDLQPIVQHARVAYETLGRPPTP